MLSVLGVASGRWVGLNVIYQIMYFYMRFHALLTS